MGGVIIWAASGYLWSSPTCCHIPVHNASRAASDAEQGVGEGEEGSGPTAVGREVTRNSQPKPKHIRQTCRSTGAHIPATPPGS